MLDVIISIIFGTVAFLIFLLTSDQLILLVCYVVVRMVRDPTNWLMVN